MNGYYRPKAHGPNQELRPLELDEIEYVTEDERPEVKRVLDEAWKHRCPRCGIVSWIIFHDPHCSECNWDSLTDVSRNGALCVA
mgnify:FL=1